MEQKPYGDPDFDPEHNKRVIEAVDKWNDEMEKKREREFREKTAERSHAAAMYLKNLAQGAGVNQVNKYFGKRELARLHAQDIVSKLQANEALRKKLQNKLEKKGKVLQL